MKFQELLPWLCPGGALLAVLCGELLKIGIPAGTAEDRARLRSAGQADSLRFLLPLLVLLSPMFWFLKMDQPWLSMVMFILGGLGVFLLWYTGTGVLIRTTAASLSGERRSPGISRFISSAGASLCLLWAGLFVSLIGAVLSLSSPFSTGPLPALIFGMALTAGFLRVRGFMSRTSGVVSVSDSLIPSDLSSLAETTVYLLAVVAFSAILGAHHYPDQPSMVWLPLMLGVSGLLSAFLSILLFETREGKSPASALDLRLLFHAIVAGSLFVLIPAQLVKDWSLGFAGGSGIFAFLMMGLAIRYSYDNPEAPRLPLPNAVLVTLILLFSLGFSYKLLSGFGASLFALGFLSGLPIAAAAFAFSSVVPHLGRQEKTLETLTQFLPVGRTLFRGISLASGWIALFLLFRIFLEKAALSVTGVDMTAIGSYLGICLGAVLPFMLLAVTQRRTLDLVDLVKKDTPAGSLDFLAFSGFLLLAVMCLVSLILTGFFFYLEGLSALLGALVASQGVILFLFFLGEGWSRYRSPANGELSVMESIGEAPQVPFLILGGILCCYLIPFSQYLSHFSRTGKVSVLAGVVAIALLAGALLLRHRKET